MNQSGRGGKAREEEKNNQHQSDGTKCIGKELCPFRQAGKMVQCIFSFRIPELLGKRQLVLSQSLYSVYMCSLSSHTV